MQTGLEVLCGLALGGSRLTEAEDLAPGSARLGLAVHNPSTLLADLELRLGIATLEPAHALRVARWSARLAVLAQSDRFYSRSYRADPWGTAAELLRWRDSLVDAGWDGRAIAGGGDRLAQLRELEHTADGSGAPFPSSEGDRLAVIEQQLTRDARAVYARVRVAESLLLWPLRWRRVFALLGAAGCVVEELQLTPSLADASSDLGRLQRHIVDGAVTPVPPEGDGSLIFLRGETPWETAHALAALLLAWRRAGEEVVVIRGADRLPLEHAQRHVGLPTQGAAAASRLRPLLQVLPLALELVFAPKDPYRILELLALPEGPFRGASGRQLARALSQMPGLGSETWQRAKLEIARRTHARHLAEALAAGQNQVAAEALAVEAARKPLARVADWIEAPGHPRAGAPSTALLEAIHRVQQWARGRMIGAGDEEAGLLAAAIRDATAVEEALLAAERPTWSIEHVRQIVELAAAGGVSVELRREEAGRIDHVDGPAALLRARPTVVWWSCTARTAGVPPLMPFTKVERDALSATGIELVDPRRQMAEAAATFRRTILAATKRCVLVASRSSAGEEVAVHPIWDELRARMGGESRDLARVSVDARQVLRNQAPIVRVDVAASPVAAIALPEPRPTWRLTERHRTPVARASVTSMERLLGCPLRWLLDDRAELRNGSLISIPKDQLLHGKLGHRLVELLHAENAFATSGDELYARALARLDAIVVDEGATLLLPGCRTEHAQLRRQLGDAVVRLADMLARSNLQIVEVERTEEVEWRGRVLEGRLDLLLCDRNGADAILDLKWGRKTRVDDLEAGVAVQLAVYGFLRQQARGVTTFPAVAYFSLKHGETLATDDVTFTGATAFRGADAEDTWRRVAATTALIEGHLGSGAVPVAAVSRGTPVVEACGAAPDKTKHLVLAPDAACRYCNHAPLCGRRWESMG